LFLLEIYINKVKYYILYIHLIGINYYILGVSAYVREKPGKDLIAKGVKAGAKPHICFGRQGK
jgi:hypothetical protein